MKEALKVYGYCRVSSIAQGKDNKDGFPRQEAAIKQYAKKNNFEVVQIFKESISGTKSENERPVFQDMLTEILRNGVKTILIERLDRLARENHINESLIIYIASKGITLLDVSTGENITDTYQQDPMKKALIQIQGVFAELEKSLLVKKLRLARERKKELTGKCEGRKSTLELKPEVIAEIRRLRRKPQGNMRKRMSYTAVAAALNEKGMLTANDKKFTGVNIQMLMRRVK